MLKKQSTRKPEGFKAPKPKGSKAPNSTLVITSKSTISVNHLQLPVVAVESLPLTDVDYKIVDPVVEFNLLDIHNWC